MTTWDFHILDVFTDQPLAGNQLAVFTDAAGIPEGLLQPLAREINFSETVFLYPAQAGGDARMRIFTPASEIPFAGHPTLGTAVLVADRLGKDAVILETGRGPIPVTMQPTSGPAVRGTMEQPLPTIAPYDDPAPLLAALGVERSLLPVTLYDNGILHVYVTMERPEDVARVAPDFTALVRLAKETGQETVGINVIAGSEVAWKTRVFVPGDGIAEDPATGSAAGPLVLHLARHGIVPWGTEISIAQGAEVGRPSTLLARASGSEDAVEKIEVSGYAVPVGGGWFDARVLQAATTS